MHGLLKKLLVLNGYMDEAGGTGDPGNGGQPGAGGESGAAGELAAGGETGGAAPGNEATGGEGQSGEPPAGGQAGIEPDAGTGGGEPKPDGAAKRYSDLTKQLKESQAQQQRSQQQLDTALQALERVTGGLKKDDAPPPVVKKPEEEELVPPEFQDIDQYQRDMAEYTAKIAARSARDALKAAEADRERERITAEQEAAKRQHADAWQSKRTAAMAKYDDYAEVAENPDVPISPVGGMVITSLEHGAEVAYYLGQHTDEARKIAALPPILQAVELGKLEARIMAPKPPAVSKAPEPIKPIQPNGGAATVRGDDELSMEEYAARRNKR